MFAVLRSLYITLLFGSTGIVALLILLIWQRRSLLGKIGFYCILTFFFLLIYNIGYAMELLQSELTAIMFWVRFQNLGIHLIGPTWLLFVLALSGNERWITPARVVVLYGLALPFLIAAQTLGGANLLHHNPRLDLSAGFATFAYDRSWINYLALAYYSLCIFSSVFIFLRMFLNSSGPLRSQATIFALASFLPWIGGSLYIFGITPYYLDTTLLFLNSSLVLLLVGFFRYGTFDIIPLARDLIFEGMNEAALVLDSQNRLVDFNPRLPQVLPKAHLIIGQPARQALKEYPSLVELIEGGVVEKVEFSVANNGALSFYQVKSSPLYKRGQSAAVGKVMIFHDITALKELMEKLEILATTDSLTQTFNRRRFLELAALEIYRVGRYGGELSLITFDLDDFKLINDLYGHLAGDAVLVHVAQTCRSVTRQSDVVARLGGEEFAILLPQTSLEAAICSAEKIRLTLEQSPVQYEGEQISVTASFGVSSLKQLEVASFTELLRRADRALYQAKRSGKNRVGADLHE